MSFNESLGKLWRVVSSKCCSTRASMSGYDCTFFCLINHFDVKLRGRFEWIRIPSNSSRLLSSVLSTSNPISSTILLNIFPDLEKYFQKFPILLIFISSRNQMLIHLARASVPNISYLRSERYWMGLNPIFQIKAVGPLLSAILTRKRERIKKQGNKTQI